MRGITGGVRVGSLGGDRRHHDLVGDAPCESEAGLVDLHDAGAAGPADTDFAGLAEPHRCEQASMFRGERIERGTLDLGALAASKLAQRDSSGPAVRHRDMVLRLSLRIKRTGDSPVESAGRGHRGPEPQGDDIDRAQE